MFPQTVLSEAVKTFAKVFPHTPLRVHVEALGAVADLVISRRCSLGIMGTLPTLPESLDRERLVGVEGVTVVAPGSSLATFKGFIPADQFETSTQLVLSDRSALTAGKDFGVFSTRTWRLADLGAKREFLLAGLGWGNMPRFLVAADLAAGKLVEIKIEGPQVGIVPMQAVYRADTRPGPAGRWLIDKLRESAPQESEGSI